MRTTVTLDQDVEDMLKKVMAERHLSFKDAVNTLLRSALLPSTSRPDYSFRSFDLGQPLVPLDRALLVAAELEDEEIVRKLATGR